GRMMMLDRDGILDEAAVLALLDNQDGSMRWGYVAVHAAVVKTAHPSLMEESGEISPAARKFMLAHRILSSINSSSVACGRCKTVLIATDPATPLVCGSCGFGGRPYINSLMAIAQNHVARAKKRRR